MCLIHVPFDLGRGQINESDIGQILHGQTYSKVTPAQNALTRSTSS